MYLRAVAGFVPVLLASPLAVGAQQVVTESDLLAVLGSESPAVVSRSAQLPLAHADLLSARTFDNPVLAIGREDPDGPIAQTELSFSWKLPDASRRLAIAAAEKQVDAATARVDGELSALRMELRQDYTRWAVADRRQQYLDLEAARLEALASRERARAEKGEASGLEAHRLGLAAAALRANLSLAESESRNARAGVARWLPDLAPDARPELPPLPPLATADSEVSSAPGGGHPLLDAVRAEVEAAELTQRASERYLATPEVFAGWQRQDDLGVEHSGPVLGLSWSIPVFDRKQAVRARAEAQLDAVRARAVTVARELEARRAAARSTYAELVRGTAASKDALEASTDMLVGAERSFRYGELTLTDLLDVQRSVAAAHLVWLELHAAALAAHRELERLYDPNPNHEDTRS